MEMRFNGGNWIHLRGGGATFGNPKVGDMVEVRYMAKDYIPAGSIKVLIVSEDVIPHQEWVAVYNPNIVTVDNSAQTVSVSRDSMVGDIIGELMPYNSGITQSYNIVYYGSEDGPIVYGNSEKIPENQMYASSIIITVNGTETPYALVGYIEDSATLLVN
jgi:hypothetical protein